MSRARRNRFQHIQTNSYLDSKIRNLPHNRICFCLIHSTAGSNRGSVWYVKGNSNRSFPREKKSFASLYPARALEDWIFKFVQGTSIPSSFRHSNTQTFLHQQILPQLLEQNDRSDSLEKEGTRGGGRERRRRKRGNKSNPEPFARQQRRKEEPGYNRCPTTQHICSRNLLQHRKNERQRSNPIRNNPDFPLLPQLTKEVEVEVEETKECPMIRKEEE